MGYSDSDIKTVQWFFTSIRALYGAAKFSSQWPDDESLRAAKAMWAPDIINLTRSQLQSRLHYAKRMGHQKDWTFPDVAKILRGDRQPCAGGQAAASYLPAQDVIGLQAPKRDKTAGSARIADLLADF